jgi:hypothetical protein
LSPLRGDEGARRARADSCYDGKVPMADEDELVKVVDELEERVEALEKKAS